MGEAAARPRALTQVLSAPLSAQAWLATIHVLMGLPIAIVAFTVVLTLVALTAGLLVTAVLAVVTLSMLLVSVRGLSALQRSRFRVLLGVDIPNVRVRHEGPWLRRLFAEARASVTWRQVGYHLLSLPISVLGYVLVTVAWSAGLAMSLVFTYRWALPDRGIFGWDMRSPAALISVTAVGLVLLLAAPWVAQAMADLDLTAARALLGPSRTQELSNRVELLARSRDSAVDAADAERRRLERDLHDGAQQRLESLAMNLGMARAKLTDEAPAARKAIEQAHDEAKQALVELRDFVRGLHPAVLNDRGLDAALSGIAARAPLPVNVRVDIARRCSPTIEAVAYFVVSEALTNVAKHAHASRAEVAVEHADNGLRIVVADDGQGGAKPDAGSVLRGLANRVASVGGTLTIDSPTGGPTLIVADLPCEP